MEEEKEDGRLREREGKVKNGSQKPPMHSGMKYQVRVRISWYKWKKVVTAKDTIKMTAATSDGSYR